MQPLAPKLEVQRRRIEDQQSDPLAPMFSDIPQHAPYCVGVLEVVLGGQFLSKAFPLRVLDEANRDGLQQQRLRRAFSNQAIQEVN